MLFIVIFCLAYLQHFDSVRLHLRHGASLGFWRHSGVAQSSIPSTFLWVVRTLSCWNGSAQSWNQKASWMVEHGVMEWTWWVVIDFPGTISSPVITPICCIVEIYRKVDHESLSSASQSVTERPGGRARQPRGTGRLVDQAASSVRHRQRK